MMLTKWPKCKLRKILVSDSLLRKDYFR